MYVCLSSSNNTVLLYSEFDLNCYLRGNKLGKPEEKGAAKITSENVNL
jgi:hypothetical protein